MKAMLTAIALGAILASAPHAAFAAPTATITQTGIGNTAYIEQTMVDATALPTSATIIQEGNNNHAGDPDTRTPGILQRNFQSFGGAYARIHQVGDENTASILQDGTKFPVNADIDQRGNNNTAAITQHIVTYSDGFLRQEGSYNVATLDESQSEIDFHGIQNGSGNLMSVRLNDASHAHPSVTQTGTQNTVYANLEGGALGGFMIEQVGNLNTVSSTMNGGDINNVIQQTGTGNTATTSQANGFNYSDIGQTGNNNLATVTQSLGWNLSLIRQIGDNNVASVLQSNVANVNPNTADIRQVGNGFVASITQAGGDNHSGIYQH
jgi:hypothetical protein